MTKSELGYCSDGEVAGKTYIPDTYFERRTVDGLLTASTVDGVGASVRAKHARARGRLAQKKRPQDAAVCGFPIARVTGETSSEMSS